MLPKGWQKVILASIAEVRTGVAKGKQGLKDPINVPYLRVANVQDGHINLDEIKTIEIERYQLDRYALNPGDVLMNEGGDFDKLGRGDVWNGEITPCLHQNHVFAVRPNQDIVLPYFLAAQAASYTGKTYFLSCAKRSTNLASINSTQLKKFPLLLPPIAEQIRIKEILSTWDKSISIAEQLLANSQQQKKALMQNLLTGKKRLPGSIGAWKEYRLEKICTFMRGKGLSKDMLIVGGKYKCVLYGELFTKYNEVIKNVISRTDSADSVKSLSGDILLPSSTTTSGIDLANATALLEDDVLLSGDINILRPNKKLACSVFLAYLLTHVKKREILARAQGITIVHLYGSDLKPIKVSLPSLEEQQKIASILLGTDHEIKSLEQQLDFFRHEKNALMQQLLTGKRRVKINQENK